MKPWTTWGYSVAVLGLLAAAVGLSGCPVADQSRPKPEPAKKVAEKPQQQAEQQPESKPKRDSESEPAGEPKAKPDPDPADEPEPKPKPEPAEVVEGEEAPKIPDLGPPLVDDADSLKKLDPVYPVWLDAKHKQVVLLAEVCRANYPLEFFATGRPRDYESVVVVDAKPSIVHAGLLAVGAVPGHPSRYGETLDPATGKLEEKFEPATGTEIEIEIRWKDKEGKQRKALAQDWIRNIQTKKALDINWVFAGSGFWTDETTGKQVYQADSVRDFISVLNVPTATLDLPIQSASALESRLFEGFVERIPPQGTPVTLILTPKLDKAKQVDGS